MTEHRYICQTEALQQAIQDFEQSQYLALDTEFVRRNAYKPILCLVQVMTDSGAIYLMDALVLDLSPFWACLQRISAVKVFHDSRQDLEIFWQESGGLPSPIFDTQLAALMLGMGESCGFARLIESELGVVLAKDQTATDWSQRPLSVEQLQYAIDDVLYLAKVYPQLLSKLTTLNRLHWIAEDNQALSCEQLYQADIVSLRKKVKAPPYFKSVQKHRLDALLLWRESIAIAQDKPRQWIVDNGSLIALAEHAPKHLDQLSAMGLSAQVIRKHGQALLTMLANPPMVPQAEALPSVDIEQFKKLKAHVEQIATEFGLRQSAFLAGKDDLTYWLHFGKRPSRLLQGWRCALLNQSNSDQVVRELRHHAEVLL
ncbi:MAG: HRDC domain-containing protein [Proteobacteria bacterium]|nr:HRDC domain-containing protein [Pseudomonadota bacterium]